MNSYVLEPYLKINSRYIVIALGYFVFNSVSTLFTQLVWPCAVNLIAVQTVSACFTCAVAWSHLVKLSKEQRPPPINDTVHTAQTPSAVTINLDNVDSEYTHEVHLPTTQPAEDHPLI